jgi:hypothetical protein
MEKGHREVLLEDIRSKFAPGLEDRQGRMRDNLRKCCAITNAVFALKVAWERSRHPELSLREIEQQVQEGILARKQKQWTSATD